MAMIPLLATLETLKNTPRRGWVIRHVPNPESVASHMYQMCIICLAYPWAAEADRSRSIEMAIVHDAPEAISGDIAPSDGISPDEKHLREKLGLDFLACLTRRADPAFTNRISALWEEYQANETPIAAVVHQVDKLEAIQQAYIYTVRHPELSLLGDFRSLRQQITDPWLSERADEVLAEWDAAVVAQDALPIMFVVGGPGVGKGTQCALAAQEFNLQHVSVGELLRQEQQSPDSVFRDFIASSFQHSVAVPATLTMMLLKRVLGKARANSMAGLLIDGFPRSAEQLRAFEEQVSNRYSTVLMECSDDEMVRRLTKRSDSSGRQDDQPDVILKRIAIFRNTNGEVLGLLSKNSLQKINSDASPDDVQKLFRAAVHENMIRSPARPTHAAVSKSRSS